MFRKGHGGWLALNIIEAILLLTAGIIFCVFSGNKDFQNTCILIVGIMITVDAVMRLVLDVVSVVSVKGEAMIVTTYGPAITGALELAAGVVLIYAGTGASNLSALFQFVAVFIGTLVIVFGAIIDIYSITYLVKKSGKTSRNVLFVILGIACIVLGALIVAFMGDQKRFIQVVFILLGIFIIAASILMLYLTINYMVKQKQEAKLEAHQAEVVAEADVVAEEKEEDRPEEENKPEGEEEK